MLSAALEDVFKKLDRGNSYTMWEDGIIELGITDILRAPRGGHILSYLEREDIKW